MNPNFSIVINEAIQHFAADLDFENDGSDLISSLFFDHIALCNDGLSEILDDSISLEDLLSISTLMSNIVYQICLSDLPESMKIEMGQDAFYGLSGLALGYTESLVKVAGHVCPKLNDLNELLMIVSPFFMKVALPKETTQIVQMVLKKYSATDSIELFLKMLESEGISRSFGSSILRKSALLRDQWLLKLDAVID